MPIHKTEFIKVAAAALGRPLPDNLFARLEASLAGEGLTYDELTHVEPVPKTRGVVAEKAFDCELDTGTRWRVLHLSKSLEVVKRTTDFVVRRGHGWERQPTLSR